MNVPVWKGAFHCDLDIAFTCPFRDVGNTVVLQILFSDKRSISFAFR